MRILTIILLILFPSVASAGANFGNITKTTSIVKLDDYKNIASSSVFYKWNLGELERNIGENNQLVTLTDIGILDDYIRKNGEEGSPLNELERNALRVAVKEKKWGAAQFIIESARARASSSITDFHKRNIDQLETVKANKNNRKIVAQKCHEWSIDVMNHQRFKSSHNHTDLLIAIRRVKTHAEMGKNIEQDIKELEYWVVASSSVGAMVLTSSVVIR